MQVFLTFDYELFFGAKTGTVEKCLIEPTEQLMDIAQKNGIPLTFFVDIGYILALKRFVSSFPNLQHDLHVVEAQLERMNRLGHSIQLHIHPHWEKAVYDGDQWIIRAEGCYKLSDFEQVEAERIVRLYYQALSVYSARKLNTFRAGGWCIQPFSQVKEVFKELGITQDTTVFPGWGTCILCNPTNGRHECLQTCYTHKVTA